MENDSNTPPPQPLLPGTILAFTPVPQLRKRANGWSAARQEQFILALEVMGSVGPALRAVGMGRASAYKLRDKEGAESFAAAWDTAIGMGRGRQYDVAMEQAINGVTTIQVHRGGSVSVRGGPDMRILNNALRETPLPPPIRP